MILYHGSNIKVAEIELAKCRPYKDFGQGFYLTDIREQAANGMSCCSSIRRSPMGFDL